MAGFCVFRVLRCPFSASTEQEWKQHCLDHFLLEEPPQSIECSHCRWWRGRNELEAMHVWKCGGSGYASPNGCEMLMAGSYGKMYMSHIKEHHYARSVPFYSFQTEGLCRHLYEKNIIDTQELEETKDTQVLSERPRKYVAVANSHEHIHSDASKDQEVQLEQRKVAGRLIAIYARGTENKSLHQTMTPKDLHEENKLQIVKEAHAKVTYKRRTVVRKARGERPWSTSASGDTQFHPPSPEDEHDNP